MSTFNFKNNPSLQLVDNFVRYTQKNIFLTGKAGTGKTTFLKYLRENCEKRLVVVAPTGVAAINAKGVTIHSFFQLPFGPLVPGASRKEGRNFRISREKQNIIRSLELLIIDEISMVRADLLDAIDETLRRIRFSVEPFGGVQLLMIGDLQQLSPVAKPDEWELLKEQYQSVYFFSSHALKKSDYISIELKHIYRQSDENFISILNSVRDNRLTTEIIERLNTRFNPNFKPSNNDGYITLTTHNRQADALNAEKLQEIKAKSYTFSADTWGDFPEFMYPTDVDLELKVGAQVMFVKNDPNPEKLFYNGKIGVLKRVEDDNLFVKCPDDDFVIEVKKLKWENTKFALNTQTDEIEEQVIGTFEQYPLRLAWAITIHKSQGLTFEKAIIDANAAFAHGQVYVALSRCKTFEGMVLTSPIYANAVIADNTVISYNKYIGENQPDDEKFKLEKSLYQQNLLLKLFNFLDVLTPLARIERLVTENFADYAKFLVEIYDFKKCVTEELVPVSDKFRRQLVSILAAEQEIEKNATLLERLKKASQYFLSIINPKLKTLLDTFSVDSDNKKVLAAIKTEEEKIQWWLNIKLACLRYTEKGFNLKEFLEVKAKAAIVKQEINSLQGSTETQEIIKKPKVKHSKLFDALIHWRDNVAEAKNIKVARTILGRKVITEIANVLPKTPTELERIKGLGSKTLDTYGEEIFEIISDYISEHREEVIKKEIGKGATYIITLELFKAGKSIAEIAKERGLAESTIGGHFVKLIAENKVDVVDVLPTDKIAAIKAEFEKFPDMQIKDLVVVSEGKYTYSEIKMVLTSMEAK
jgi:uncharacterized protein YpbB